MQRKDVTTKHQCALHFFCARVQSGFKSSENYSWKRYPEPKIISIGAGAANGAANEAAHTTGSAAGSGHGAARRAVSGGSGHGGSYPTAVTNGANGSLGLHSGSTLGAGGLMATYSSGPQGHGSGGGGGGGPAAGQWAQEGSHRASRLFADRPVFGDGAS